MATLSMMTPFAAISRVIGYSSMLRVGAYRQQTPVLYRWYTDGDHGQRGVASETTHRTDWAGLEPIQMKGVTSTDESTTKPVGHRKRTGKPPRTDHGKS